MAVTHVGTNKGNATSGNPLTLTLPAHNEGDLIVLAYHASNLAGSISEPSGYTLIRTTGAAATNHRTYYKVAGAGESDPAFDPGTGSSFVAGIVSVFRGVKQTGPLDQENGQENASSTSTTAPGVTTTIANDLMIHTTAFTVASPSHTPPADYTEPTNGESVVTSRIVALSYKIGQAQGATGDVVGTANSAAVNQAHLAAFFESAPATTRSHVIWL